MSELAEIKTYYDGDIDHMREVYHDYDVAKDEDGTMEISVPGMNDWVPVPLGCTVSVSSWEDSTFYFYVTDMDGESKSYVRTR